MGKNISTLKVVLDAITSPFSSAMGSATGAVQSFAGSAVSMGGKLAGIIGIVGAAKAAMAAFGGLGSSISLAAELESNATAFETMTGSADAAKTMMGQLQSFASATPFQFPELASSAKKLLAFGTSADQIVPTLKMLGDVSSGIGAPLNEIAELFGKAKVQGTLMAEDINQLVGRGIPVIQQFAKQLGVSEGQVKDMASKGKINFGMLQKAMADMTAEGGQFFGMMDKQSTTLGGLWSTLTDGISMSMAGMVTTIVDAFKLKGAITALIGFTGSAGDYLTNLVKKIAPIVMSAGSTVFGIVSAIFNRIYSTVAPIVTGVANFIAASWSSIVGVASAVFTTVWGVISTAFNAVYSFVSEIVTAVWGVIASNWEMIVDTTVAYWTSIYGLIESALGLVWTVVSGVGQGIAGLWTSAMNLLGVSTTSTGSTVKDAFGGIMTAWRAVADFLTGTITLVSFVFSNFGTIVAAALVGGAYQIVKFGNQIGYVFGDVVPAYLLWLAQNFGNILLDMGNMFVTVTGNMLKNAAAFGSALWSAIKGEGFNFEFTSLTDGFQSSLTELPAIADRQIGDLEKSLGDESAVLGKALGDGLAESFNKQTDRAKSASDGIKDTIKGIGKSITDATNAKPPEMKPPTMPGGVKIPPLKLDNSAANKAIDQTKQKTEDLAAVFSGSAESLQLSAQLAFDQMKTTGTPTPAPATSAGPTPAPLPSVATDAMRDSSKQSDNSLKELFTKLIEAAQKGNVSLAAIDTNTKTPQIAQASV